MNDAANRIADELLLQGFVRGDSKAFDLLVERYQRPLYTFILRQVRESGRAEELLQDTFLRVIERAEDFKGESKFSTWLYTIARNLCIDSARKMAFRRHASLDSSGADRDGPSLLERIAANDPNAERGAMASDLRLKIAAAVEALPDDQREVFLLRELQRLPFKEIGDIVGAPENTVKSRMRYALERLQQALADYAEFARTMESQDGRP